MILKKRVRRRICAATTIVLTISAMTSVEASGPSIAASIPQISSSWEWEVLLEVNERRAEKKLEPLSMTETLQTAADIRAADLNESYTKERPDGSTLEEFLEQMGVPKTTAKTQVIARGWESPQELVNAAQNGHVTEEMFDHIGIGYTPGGANVHSWAMVLTGKDCTIEKISLADSKAGLKMGDGISVASLGLVLRADCAHGASYLPIISSMCEIDPQKIGEIQQVTVNYKGCTTTFLAQTGVPFIDVKPGDWYYNNAKYVYQNGVMTGMKQEVFGASATLARAQVALILYRLEKEPAVSFERVFADIHSGLWYTDAILWANQAGVVTGYQNGSFQFGPADHITREQMAVMMYRYARYKGYDTKTEHSLAEFSDEEKVSAFARTAMEWAVAKGVITGKGKEPKLAPQGEANRAECAAIIERFMENCTR